MNYYEIQFKRIATDNLASAGFPISIDKAFAHYNRLKISGYYEVKIKYKNKTILSFRETLKVITKLDDI